MKKRMLAATLCLSPCASPYAQGGVQAVENAQKLLSIVLRSEGLAKRVVHGIKFLRMQCDTAAGTGF